MKILSVQDIAETVSLLQKGNVIAFPTDTSYGLGVDATQSKAVRRIAVIKGRKLEKTPPLLAADLPMAEHYLQLSPALRKVAQTFWPGPLTIVAPVVTNSGLAPEVIREDGTIAVRVANDPFVRELVQQLGRPITATSANRAGEPDCYDSADVVKSFSTSLEKPDGLVDAGQRPFNPPSTIVAEEDGRLVVLRQGSVKIPGVN